MFAGHSVLCDLLSQCLESAAANGNVGGVSIEGFAFSVTCWHPKTENEPGETAVLCFAYIRG